MKTHLHKLPEGFVLTSDETPNKGYDGYYFLDGKLFHTSKVLLQTGCKEVIAQQHQLGFSELSLEDQKKIGWFDVEKLAKKAKGRPSVDVDLIPKKETNVDAYFGFLEGFQKAQELLSDKQFTLSDIRNSISFGQSLGYNYASEETYSDSQEMKEIKLDQNEDIEKYTQRLTKTSWEVEIEMEISILSMYSHEIVMAPKFTDGKIKILKLL
jgi:hypothetical protein